MVHQAAAHSNEEPPALLEPRERRAASSALRWDLLFRVIGFFKHFGISRLASGVQVPTSEISASCMG